MCTVAKHLNSFNFYSAGRYSFRRILDHFRVRFGSVRMFGYNCAESKPIGMKSGVHCWGIILAHFGHDLRSSDSLRRKRSFSV